MFHCWEREFQLKKESNKSSSLLILIICGPSKIDGNIIVYFPDVESIVSLTKWPPKNNFSKMGFFVIFIGNDPIPRSLGQV